MNEYFITAKEAASILRLGERTGYKILQELNEELKAKGYLTVQGRCPKKYFYERMGIVEEAATCEN